MNETADGSHSTGANSKDNLPSTSQNSDNNANLNMTTTDESKGAIPKTKLTKLNSKKTNNNVEELKNFGNDILKRNGYVKTNSANYLNRVYDGSDSESESGPSTKDLLRKSGDYQQRTPLNIPVVEDDFLAYVPLNNSESGYANGTKKCGSSFGGETKDCDTSSSDDNELLSVSDDGCIYTYKGDHVADLPRSFFNLEIPPLEDISGDLREENSSPEMDFLEMDFDPGPSGDADSDSISNAEIDEAANLPLDSSTKSNQPEAATTSEIGVTSTATTSTHQCSNEHPLLSSLSLKESPNQFQYLNNKIEPILLTNNKPIKSMLQTKTEVKMPWSCTLTERTRCARHLRNIKRHHSSKGELSSPNETATPSSSSSSTSSALSISMLNGDTSQINPTSHNNTNKVDEKQSSNDLDKIMIWTTQEACLKQITQVGPSACGATAVLNVLNALRLPIPTIERVQEAVSTRLRANTSPLKEYLLSRSVAGCNHRDIIKALYKLSDKRIYARFFSMYPERIVNLQKWLGYWIKNGAVPIATINLQKCDGYIPDSWHHQMIFGVGPKGIYMVNPFECVDPSQLWPQLSSESILLIKTEDIINRWNSKTDLKQLSTINDVRWKRLNVIGQIARVIRENQRDPRSDHVSTTHIKIPADYSAGITLAIDITSPAYNLLRQCPELPLLHPEDAAGAL